MSEPGDTVGTAAGSGAEHRDDPPVTLPSTKPVVLPETFDGTRDWEEWCFHFENVASVNGWDDADKLKWLRVRLTGRAQKALHRLTDAQWATYEATRLALNTRFDPESRQTRYQAEFQTRRKKAGEGWADLADDLKSLADKAYPTLQEEAREQLSINTYLQQLTPPQLAFSVKQKRPNSLDSAVAATLEMESYLTHPNQGGVASAIQSENEAICPIDASDKVDKLTHLVEQLAVQFQNEREKPGTQTSTQQPYRRRWDVECWKCHQRGHIARFCPQNRISQPGN